MNTRRLLLTHTLSDELMGFINCVLYWDISLIIILSSQHNGLWFCTMNNEGICGYCSHWFMTKMSIQIDVFILYEMTSVFLIYLFYLFVPFK